MPRLAVVLPALGGLETVQAVLRRWEAQAPGGELELILLVRGDDVARARAPWRRTVDCGDLLLHQARARGIRAASAEFVVLAEDHCVPDDGWAAAVLGRLEEGWDGVVSCLRPGDAPNAWSQAAFLIGYGEWMPPLASGATSALPGHNVILRRRSLLELGDELEELLLVCSFLVRRLARSGRFCLETGATMRHYDATGLRDQLRVFETVGRAFGAVRTRHRPALARALYPLALPAVAAAHWRRALVHYRRAGAANGMRPACLAAAGVFACVWAWGEAVGALLGPSRVAAGAWISETKPVPERRLDAENA